MNGELVGRTGLARILEVSKATTRNWVARGLITPACRIDDLKTPVVLVGHSYGGAVITQAGNAPKVAALVYITAWGPAKGESVGSLLKTLPPDAVPPPILPPQDGFLLVDREKFPAAFAGDVSLEVARFHGRLASTVECRGSRRYKHSGRVGQQAQLVRGDDRKSHDLAGHAANHGNKARRFDGRRTKEVATRSRARAPRQP